MGKFPPDPFQVYSGSGSGGGSATLALSLGLSILFCLLNTVQLAEGRGSGNCVGCARMLRTGEAEEDREGTDY